MDEGPRERSFHGRRKGKQLRLAQASRLDRMLPNLRIDRPADGELIDPARLFQGPVARIVLEIGFGGGEHLAFQARSDRASGHIGVEAFVNGTAKLLAAVETDGLANVRIFDDDAGLLLPALAPGSVDLIYVLYPDPWPKRRQRKRRFLNDENLALLARALRPGGELRFATDIDDYAGWVLARVARSPDLRWDAQRPAEWRTPWPDWPGTRYEAKALGAGRAPTYLTFRSV